jgi:uncharacterized protein
MSIHKFRVTNTGTIFHYDNLTNGLLDDKLNKLSMHHNYPEEYVNYLSQRNTNSEKVIAKKSDPVMIKLTLGQKCNFSCGYCSQRELGDNQPSRWGDLRREMEVAKVGNLIRDMKDNLDFTHLRRFELWGGETLIYWREIQMVMEAFDRPGMVWYIPTNGSLIKQEHVDFFAARQGTVTLGVSHDGYCHTITRGEDFLNRQAEIFRAMQNAAPKIQFSFNPVISKYNYDLFKMDEFFRDWVAKHNLKPVSICYEVITVYNLEEVRGESKSYALQGEDLAAYSGILKKYLAAHAEQYQSKQGNLLWTNLFELTPGVLPFAKSFTQEDLLHSATNCSADSERQLTIDTDGDVKTCQNVGREFKFGNIKAIEEVAVTNVNTNKKERCWDCRLKHICRSGCPIEQPDEVFDTNCALYTAHWGNILHGALEFVFNSPVEYLGRV